MGHQADATARLHSFYCVTFVGSHVLRISKTSVTGTQGRRRHDQQTDDVSDKSEFPQLSVFKEQHSPAPDTLLSSLSSFRLSSLRGGALAQALGSEEPRFDAPLQGHPIPLLVSSLETSKPPHCHHQPASCASDTEPNRTCTWATKPKHGLPSSLVTFPS